MVDYNKLRFNDKEKKFLIHKYRICSPSRLVSNPSLFLKINLNDCTAIRKSPSTLRFVNCISHPTSDYLAAVNSEGIIMIIQIPSKRYWLLPKIGRVTTLAFSLYFKNNLIVGNHVNHIIIFNIELGEITAIMEGHSSPAFSISFTMDHRFCLSASKNEAIIWNLKMKKIKQKLIMHKGILIKMAFFLPVKSQILACFQDDSLHIWDFGTFKETIRAFPKHFKGGDIKSITTTRNCKYMAVGGFHSAIVIFNLEDLEQQQVYDLPSYIGGIKYLEFMPPANAINNQTILGIHSLSDKLYFLNIDDSNFLSIDKFLSYVKKFIFTPTSNYIVIIYKSGELEVHLLDRILASNIKEEIQQPKSFIKIPTQGGVIKQKKTAVYKHLESVSSELKETLDLKRLAPILKQYGIYPNEYRTVIWKALMQIPNNREAFILLANQRYIPGSPKCRLENQQLQNRCNRVLNSLSHQAPILAQTEFLSNFVFPFMKTFENDLVAAFEVIYTILKNWCQHWWSSFPFAPFKILDPLEKILEYHEPQLYYHFEKCRVGPELFAWLLLKSVFSEVLEPTAWHQLWDHILSNEPAFLHFATIAYSSVTFPLHKTFTKYEEYEEFFRQQNIINMKRFISKIYYYLNHTPKQCHPRNILIPFKALDKETYDSFDQFPEFMNKYKKIHLSSMHSIQQMKKDQQHISLAVNNLKDAKVKNKFITEENAQLKALEESYCGLLAQERARIIKNEQNLVNLSEKLCQLESSPASDSSDKIIKHKGIYQMKPKIYKKIDSDKTLEELENETKKFIIYLK